MKIADIPPISYRKGELSMITFIRGGEGWKFHQGPTIYEYPDGLVFMCWGVYDIQECSNDGAVVYSTSKDMGETWSGPELWMKTPNSASTHPCLLQLRGTDKVLMSFSVGHFVGAKVDARLQKVVKWADYGKTRRLIYIQRSATGGVIWDTPEVIPPELIVPEHEPSFYGAPQQLLQLSNGEILLTICYLPPKHRYPQHYHVAFLFSKDGGNSWKKGWDFTVPEERGAMEPSIVELDDGEMFGIVRNKSGFSYDIRSDDYGRTWNEPGKTNIPTVESMSKVLRLQSGNILMVWNNQSSTTQRPRHPLVAALSKDGGRSWDREKILADEVGLNQLSNFGVIQLRDGRILLCTSHYTAQAPNCSDLYLAVFDEQWVAAGT